MTTLSTADLLEWVPVATGQRARCDCCSATLRPNDRIEVLVTRTDGDLELVARRCVHCARGRLRTGTRRACWLARGWLAASVDGRGRSRVVLSGASVIDRNAD